MIHMFLMPPPWGHENHVESQTWFWAQLQLQPAVNSLLELKGRAKVGSWLGLSLWVDSDSFENRAGVSSAAGS